MARRLEYMPGYDVAWLVGERHADGTQQLERVTGPALSAARATIEAQNEAARLREAIEAAAQERSKPQPRPSALRQPPELWGSNSNIVDRFYARMAPPAFAEAARRAWTHPELDGKEQ